MKRTGDTPKQSIVESVQERKKRGDFACNAPLMNIIDIVFSGRLFILLYCYYICTCHCTFNREFFFVSSKKRTQMKGRGSTETKKNKKEKYMKNGKRGKKDKNKIVKEEERQKPNYY
jgi:hypothetical protein